MTKNELTDYQALMGWVERAMERGWDVDKAEQYITSWGIEGKRIVFYAKTENGCYSHREYSLPDLIANHPFMKAVYGSEIICRSCGKGLETQADRDVAFNFKTKSFHCLYCGDYSWMIAFNYYQRLLITLPADERIGYIKSRLVKDEENKTYLKEKNNER